MTQLPKVLSVSPTDGDNLDDDALMQAVAAGDQRAFQVLMRRHLGKTVRLAARMLGSDGLADDVAQEAFVRVWKHAPNWLSGEKAGAKFTTWLYRIVLNLVIDEKRKNRFTSIDVLAEVADDAVGAHALMESREQAARVRAAMQELPERQRAALLLCFFEGYSNKEAADILDISVKALESLLVRSRKFLRDALKEERS